MSTRCPECGIKMRYRIKTNDWVCLGGCKTIITDEQALSQKIAESQAVVAPIVQKPQTQNAEEVRFENMSFGKK